MSSWPEIAVGFANAWQRQSGCGQKSFQLQKFLLLKRRQSCNCKMAPSHRDPDSRRIHDSECNDRVNSIPSMVWVLRFTLQPVRQEFYLIVRHSCFQLPPLPWLLELAIHFQQEYCFWLRTVRKKVKLVPTMSLLTMTYVGCYKPRSLSVAWHPSPVGSLWDLWSPGSLPWPFSQPCSSPSSFQDLFFFQRLFSFQKPFLLTSALLSSTPSPEFSSSKLSTCRSMWSDTQSMFLAHDSLNWRTEDKTLLFSPAVTKVYKQLTLVAASK